MSAEKGLNRSAFQLRSRVAPDDLSGGRVPHPVAELEPLVPG